MLVLTASGLASILVMTATGQYGCFVVGCILPLLKLPAEMTGSFTILCILACAAAACVHYAPPSDVACWDLNMNGRCDVATEDINGDGDCNVQDCMDAAKTAFIQRVVASARDPPPPNYQTIQAKKNASQFES